MKKAVLYYFPYAGASTVSFKNIENYFSEDIEPVCFEYAAHGKRITDAKYNSVSDLASDMLDKIITRNDKAPIYLSGHCLGAIAAYEVYFLMKKAGITNISGLIISGQGVPDDIVSEHLQDMSEDKLLEYLADHQLVDKAMTDPKYKRFVSDLILKPITADSVIYDSYVNSHNSKIDVPINILYGNCDERYPADKLRKWRDYTNKNIELSEFNGDHYFLRENEKEYFAKINEIIEKDIR